MNILSIAELIPTPSNLPGSPRSFCFARELSYNHEVSLVVFGDRDSDGPLLDALAETSVYSSIELLPLRPQAKPPLSNRFRHFIKNQWYQSCADTWPDYLSRMIAKIRDICHRKSIDVIYADGLSSKQFVPSEYNDRAFLDICDTPSEFYKRLFFADKSWTKKLVARRAIRAVYDEQRNAISRFPITLFISNVERDAVIGLGPHGKLRVISNGVDFDYFHSDDIQTNNGVYVFVGVMNYSPNLDAALHFIEDIFPHISRWDPDARFIAVGKGAPPELLALNARPGIEITGEVEDVRPWVKPADAFVCPLRIGAGMKNKILAAMSMKVPVVCTRISLEGIEAIPGTHLLVADSPDEYRTAFDLIRNSPNRRAALIENAYQLVVEKYSWLSKRKELNDVVDSIVQER